MMKVALDVMGGDFAPRTTLEGAILASKKVDAGTQIVLIGQEDVISSQLSTLGADASVFQIIHAPEVVGMGEHPTKAISQKPKSSINIGFHLLKNKEVDAFCSAGNTGAMLVGSLFSVKAIEGVLRPGIAGFIPKESGRFGIVLDVGANAECKAEVLAQFASIGSLYAKYYQGIENPKIGLMNLGEEEEKGTTLLQAAHGLIKQLPNINFVGNVEGRDVFNDKADVIVCDGYTGNVILKMAESFYNLTNDRGFQHPFFSMFNYEEVGGSPILGVNGNVIIGHGSSSAKAIMNMILQGQGLVKSDITEKIKKAYS
jgi:glycerol-3-phosphate acyltransferase PlsX